MKSEKEIKEFLEDSELDYWQDKRVICKWILEGEPRYSVAELEKIWEFFERDRMDGSTATEIVGLAFLKFLKDKKKVKRWRNDFCFFL